MRRAAGCLNRARGCCPPQVLQYMGDRQGSLRYVPVTPPAPVALDMDSVTITGLQLQARGGFLAEAATSHIPWPTPESLQQAASLSQHADVLGAPRQAGSGFCALPAEHSQPRCKNTSAHPKLAHAGGRRHMCMQGLSQPGLTA